MNETLQTQSQMTMMRAAERQAMQKAQILDMAKNTKNIEAIEEAAKDFEAVFLTQMLKPMFKGLKPDPTFGGGKGEEVFQGLLIQEYGKAMADRGGIGLAEHVKAELLKIQEETSNGIQQ